MLCLASVFTLVSTAFAADIASATIDHSKTGSITIYKYDTTTAQKNGLKDGVYLSTGKENPDAAAAYAPYAIPGVEFTILRVGDIDTYTVSDGKTNTTQVIYGVSDSSLLSALGLSQSDRVTVKNSVSYYSSDKLINALASKLTTNNTSTKDTVEKIISSNKGSKALALTDKTGKTSASKLDLGLYLVVETKTPEEVTHTVDPFFVSIPMTDVEQHNNWFYDVTVYPKNQTGVPDLSKQVADHAHGLSYSAATEGYSDVATASTNDQVDYRILSTLPQIHSTATYLTQYDFVDKLSRGISYNEEDVKICWYKDRETAEKDYVAATESKSTTAGSKADATWKFGSDFFSVTYGSGDQGGTTMDVKLTAKGLAEVNKPATVSDQQGKYSGWTMVIYYTATVKASDAVVYGDNANPNDVTLTWSRTTDGYYDTLTDEAKVYVFGIDLTKVLSEGGTAYKDVKFVIQNSTNVTGSYYLEASKSADGVYYITGSTDKEADANRFTPDGEGKLLVYGLEEDSYVITEVETAAGYTLLKEPITVEITTSYAPGDKCGALNATATVDKNLVTMEKAGNSDNALVPLTVLNTKGFDLPKTGGPGTLATTICGVLIVTAMASLAFFTRKRKHG